MFPVIFRKFDTAQTEIFIYLSLNTYLSEDVINCIYKGMILTEKPESLIKIYRIVYLGTFRLSR